MDIVQRNFFSLIRSGGLNEFVGLEPMSPFKWRQLMAMSIGRKVEDTLLQGLRHHQYDRGIEIPSALLGMTPTPVDDTSLAVPPTLSCWLLNRRLSKIRYDERHAIDTSVETLQLLDILIVCISTMFHIDLSVRQILRLGIFLRTRGDKVDFVKLDQWLSRLHLQRAAQLQGSILMVAMGFEQDELPFVTRQEPAAMRLLAYSLRHSAGEYEEWHIEDNKPVFIKSNSRALFRSLRRCARYARYAPLESISHLLGGMAKSISEIDE